MSNERLYVSFSTSLAIGLSVLALAATQAEGGVDPGACCDGFGTCTDVADCINQCAGLCYPGQTCPAPNQFGVSQCTACCHGDGSCTHVPNCTDNCNAERDDCKDDPVAACANTYCPPPTGACCQGENCTDNVPQPGCENNSGTYQGDFSTCASLKCCTTGTNCDDGYDCTFPDECNFGTGVCQTHRDDPYCRTGPGGFDGKTCTDDACNPELSLDSTGCFTSREDANCPDDLYTCTSHECVPTDPDADPETGCITKKNNPNPICDDYDDCTEDDCNPAGSPKGSTTGCVNSEIDGCCESDADCLSYNGVGGCEEHFCNPKGLCDTRQIPDCGACCGARIGVATANDLSNCFETSEINCDKSGGVYQGDGTTCSPGLCVKRLSVSEKGSILFYSGIELGFSPIATTAGPGFSPTQDTFITLVNDLNQDVCVEWHFINGDPPLAAIPGVERAHPGWNSFDCVACYTPHENVYMSLLRGSSSLGCGSFLGLDPGSPPGRPDPEGLPGDRILRGFVVAFAVDADGIPISWNHLSGHVDVVNYRDRSAWEYNTYAFPCVIQPTPGLPCGPDPTTLSMDGIEYALAWDQLLFDFYAVGSTALSRTTPATVVTLDTDLTLHPVSVDLRPNGTNSGGPVLTKAEITIWNENEDDRTGTSRCINCWDQTLLSNYDAPNNFLINFLGTNKGKARINGVQSDDCDAPGSCCCTRQCSVHPSPCEDSSDCQAGEACGLFNCFDPDCDLTDFRRGTPDRDCSENAALIGLSDKILTFGGAFVHRTDAGMTLVGIGTQAAAIRRIVITPTAPLGVGALDSKEGTRPASTTPR